MNVLYQQGLEDMAARLAAMGFALYPMNSRVPADAVLYTSDAHAALRAQAAQRGAALLCVRGLSAGQIALLLRRRGCATLFEGMARGHSRRGG